MAIQRAVDATGVTSARTRSRKLCVSAVTLAVWGIIAWAMLRKRRGSLSEHMPWNTGGGIGWIVAGGVIARSSCGLASAS